MTKVVVLEKFKKNWEIGSVVSVKDGYARNYLIPNGMAKFATKLNIEEIKKIEESLLKKDDENKSNASIIASKVNNLRLTKEIAAKENGELYGSLTVSDIVTFLAENDLKIQKKFVKLGNKIKTIGEYSAALKICGLLYLVTSTFQISFGPYAYSIWHEEGANKKFSDWMILYFALLLTIGVISTCFGEFIITIFDQNSYALTGVKRLRLVMIKKQI